MPGRDPQTPQRLRRYLGPVLPALQFYNMLVAAQEYRVVPKLLFGTDYPFAKSRASILGLLNANQVSGSSGLPRVSEETIQEILERDSFSLLGLG